MSKKELTQEKNNKKRNIIIIVSVLLLLIILFLLWFFNRKFDVTFDLNNGTNDNIVKVKYNKLIKEEDIKIKEDLGNKFLGWYEVIEVKDDKEILDDEVFNFDTKIKKNIKLNAVYDGTPDTITITFDSKGGSKVKDVVINKGSALSLPKAPTYKGYKFSNWATANGKKVANNTKFNENTTLYAVWEKVEEKTTTTAKTTTTTTTKPAEESISLKIDKRAISINGYKTATAKADVKNSQGAATYSLSGNCAEINPSTGVITAKACNEETWVKVTATSKTGKTATAEVKVEKDLNLRIRGNSTVYTTSTRVSDVTSPFEVGSNQMLLFTGACASQYKNCTYSGEISVTKTNFKGNFNVTFSNGTTDDRTSVAVTASTLGGQKITLTLSPKVN